jgi:HlyD family secretion protein
MKMPKLPQMNKKLLLGVAGGAIVLIGGAAFLFRGPAAAAGKYEYQTVAVERGTVARVVAASGAIQPRDKTPVGSEVSGKIVEVLVDFNDVVKKGQVLAVVDPETFQNTLAQNRARLRQAEASVANARTSISRAEVALDKAQKDFTRQKALFGEGAISQAAWETAQQTYTNAQLALQSEKDSLTSSLAGLETARAQVQDSLTKLERTNIRSSMDGVILDRKVEVGQTVQSSQQVATLFQVASDLSLIEIETSVVESDIGGIDPGDPARFTVDAFPTDSFRGEVVQVRKLGGEQANVVTYTVVVNAQNPNGKLLPGMTANVEITADRAENVLRIPATATRFQPPKDVLEAMGMGQGNRGGPGGQGGFPGGGMPGGGQGGQGGGQGAQVAGFPGGGQGGGQNFQGNRGGQGGQNFQGNGGGDRGGQGAQQGGNRGGGQGGPGGGSRGGFGGGFGGQNNPMGEWLKAAGVDDARAQKIMTEMQAEMERVRASMPMPQQQQGGILPGGGGGFGPPPQMIQQQQMQEMRTKMMATQDAVLKRNLSEEEFAAVNKSRVEMQSQRRVVAWTLNDKGQPEPRQITIGLSDGSFAQVLRGAEEGDKFIVSSAAAGSGGGGNNNSGNNRSNGGNNGGGNRPPGGPGFGG